jgi:hypothetical protein
MKTLTKLTLVATMLLIAVSANAQSYYSGSSRDYVYRNPYAATPSVRVHDYFWHDGSYVPSHFRTSPNSTPTDNLNSPVTGRFVFPEGYLVGKIGCEHNYLKEP